MTRAQSQPVILTAEGATARLERISLSDGTYSETWLQKLLQAHPFLLPVSDIEPGFGELVPLALEVPCGHGYIDNLFLTPAGEVIIVEVKLWRNSQARREVVAQSLDYVAALTRFTYDDFEEAVMRGEGDFTSLYDAIKHHPDALDEAQFVDAVARNLARGRILVVALGDGIRSETETLSELLQSHAGAHFTFALVEVATWRNLDTDEIIAVPSTLAKTVMIERGIVRVEEGRATVQPIPKDSPSQPQSLSSASFYDLMAERDSRLPNAIRAFIDRVEPLGVYPDQLASLNFKVEVAGFDKPINLGYIQKNGQFWTTPTSWSAPEDVWKPYLNTLAEAISGKVVTGADNYVSIDGKSAPRIEQLLPEHGDVWVAAVEALIAEMQSRSKAKD